ncbi:unannotated protein [freshwater metagenome]|uniref:Unannotated protein n=1 Tax=freshwater metagenome TaxID=449393 RepID=A0A6J6US18_9ZZZZ
MASHLHRDWLVALHRLALGALLGRPPSGSLVREDFLRAGLPEVAHGGPSPWPLVCEKAHRARSSDCQSRNAAVSSTHRRVSSPFQTRSAVVALTHRYEQLRVVEQPGCQRTEPVCLAELRQPGLVLPRLVLSWTAQSKAAAPLSDPAAERVRALARLDLIPR